MAHVVIDGPGFPGVSISLREGITTFGRLPANDIVLNDQQVSRHHARISFFEREATFQDLDSHNGSLVNDRLTTTAVLTADDVIRIGPFRIRFRIGPPETGRDATPAGRSVGSGLETTSRRPSGSHLSALLLRAIDNTLVAPPKEALSRTLAAVDQAFRADRSALVRRRSDGRLRFVHGREEGQTSDLPSVQSEIVEWVVQRRFPVSSENPRADPRFSASDSTRPAACVPIGHDERLWGALYVERSTPSFSLADLDALQAVAHLIHTFIERRQAASPPWRLGPGTEPDTGGGAVAVDSTVVAIEFGPAHGAISDTVSEDPTGDPWDPTELVAVAEAARRVGALWVGQDDRRVILACPPEAGPAAGADVVRRLRELAQRTPRVRVGLAYGPLTVHAVTLPGSTRLFAHGAAFTAATRHLQSAEWGVLVADADRAESLESAGFRTQPTADGRLRVELFRAAVRP